MPGVNGGACLATTSGALGRDSGLTVSENNVAVYDLTYGYDASGRFNSTAGFTYTYTANSHLLASIAHPASGWAQYRTHLPNANTLDIIETRIGVTTKAKFDHTHDALYRATTILKTGEQFSTYGDGTQGLETDHAYNDRSELTADSTTLGGTSTPLTGRDDYFSYDPIGNRTQVLRSGATVHYTANNLNQYTAFTGSATHTYDDDGNLTSTGVWNYTWDAENRLVSAETASGVTPAKRLEFAYDYQKRRVRKIVKDWGGGAWITVTDLKFLHDGANTLLELDNLNSLAKVRAHIWGLDLSGTIHGAGGVGGLLYTYHYPTAKVLLPAYDGNGNISGYLDSSGGGWLAKFEYDAFGRTIAESGTHAAAAKFRFATKHADTETGLVNFGYRLYSPALGRFINRDPIEEQGGLNLYAYAANDPVNRFDVLGLWGDSLFTRDLVEYDGGGPMGDRRWGRWADAANDVAVTMARVVVTASRITDAAIAAVRDEILRVQQTLPGATGGAASSGSEPAQKEQAPNKPERWSDEKCKGLAARIAAQQSSLNAFRNTHDGSYVESSGLAGQKAAADFARLYGGSASNYVSQGVGWAGVASLVAEAGARRFGGAAAVRAVDAGSSVISGFTHPTNLGLAGNDLNQGNGTSAAGNFAEAAGDITALVLTGAQAAPVYGWILAGGSAAIFVTENIAMANIQSGARSDIAAHYSRLTSIEAAAVSRLSENQASYERHCK